MGIEHCLNSTYRRNASLDLPVMIEDSIIDGMILGILAILSIEKTPGWSIASSIDGWHCVTSSF